MKTWLEAIRDYLRDGVYDGLSFFLTLLVIVVPFISKRFGNNSQISKYVYNFIWILIPIALVISLFLSAYYQQFIWLAINGSGLLALYLWQRWENEHLRHDYERLLSQLSELTKDQAIASSEIRERDSFAITKEINFLHAYFTVFKPETRLSDNYSDIIAGHYDQILSEVQKLELKQDWQTLLTVKQRLREYFEYSGRYLDGVKFGRLYVQALEQMGQKEEAIWERIKHIGYLSILAGRHEQARKELKEALDQLAKLPQTENQNVCYFYCNRYLGISYQRDVVSGDLNIAKEYFDEAEKYVARLQHNKKKYKELYARILANFGNIALAEHRYADAIYNYERSQELFLEVDDREHLGISKLQIAQASISNEDKIEAALGLLDEANLIFIDLGWLEGQGRVFEQQARAYEVKARKSRSSKEQKEQYIEQSLNAAKRGEALFRRIGLERPIGRIEELRSKLKSVLDKNDILEPSIKTTRQ